MTLTPEERIERQFRLDVGKALEAALEGVDIIRPLRCTIHDRMIAECDQEGEDCTVKDCEPYPTALIAEFAVIVDWMIPQADPLENDRQAAYFFSNGMARTHKMGLLQAVMDEM